MVLAYADPRILGREEEAGSPLSREPNAGPVPMTPRS